MPLDRTIQELEARLPDLRHLIADGEIVLATSDTAALLADELEFLLRRADTVAGRLRHLLLGGDLATVVERDLAPPAPAPLVEDAPPGSTDVPEALSELDEELMRVLGLVTESAPVSTVESEYVPPEQAMLGRNEEERETERKLRLSQLQELEQMARHIVNDQDQINNLWRELGLDRPDDDLDDLAGGAAVGARLNPPPTPRGPGAGRTFEAAEEPPRNP